MTRPATLCLLLASCGASSLPAIQIVNVTPASMRADESVILEISVEGSLPYSVDYARVPQIELLNRAQIRLGETDVGTAEISADGALRLALSDILEPGDHPLTVTLADGRQATASDEFTVRPGRWPDGYQWDAISDQKRGESFDVRLRATGSNATSFSGYVQLSVDRGTVLPRFAGPFSSGVRSQKISVWGVTGNTRLTATNGSGRSGVSNEFLVRP